MAILEKCRSTQSACPELWQKRLSNGIKTNALMFPIASLLLSWKDTRKFILFEHLYMVSIKSTPIIHHTQ